MSFAIDIRQWKTVAEFKAHLAAHDPAICNWVQGLVVHHTWRPTQSQWRGRASVEGLKTFYENQNPPWDSGPHLFIATGSPNPADDGIWQMTPLNMQGTHARQCNPTTWGMEVVGDYMEQPWSTATRNLAVGAVSSLFQWRGLTVTEQSLKGHRDCNKTSCPGDAINLDDVRRWVSEAMGTPAPTPLMTPTSPILAPARVSQDKATRYILNRKPTPEYNAHDLSVWIIPAYFALGQQTGVDPCFALAQAIHETANFSSWWAQRPRRNPAGIGVTGEARNDQPVPEEVNAWAYSTADVRWLKGLSFPSWQVSALAHMGRLCAYATKPADRNAQQQAIIQQALMFRPLPAHLHGVAPTCEGLNGRWAYPGRTYAQQIVKIANAMIGG